MLREFLNDQAGGLVPLARVDRTVHTVDGVTYRIEVVWFRRRAGFDYHAPHLPRDVRRARAIERARQLQADRENRIREDAMAGRLMAGHRFAAGDAVPNWVQDLPDYVLEVRDGQHDVWRRPVDDQERFHDGQAYDWVQATGLGDIAGWTTNEGLREWHPIIVTKVAVDVEDAHHAA